GATVADDGGPELPQQRLDGILVLAGVQAAGVQQVVVVGRGSRFLASNREVLSSRHGKLMPGWRARVSAKRRTRTRHSYDLGVSGMLPCVMARRPEGRAAQSNRYECDIVHPLWCI